MGDSRACQHSLRTVNVEGRFPLTQRFSPVRTTYEIVMVLYKGLALTVLMSPSRISNF